MRKTKFAQARVDKVAENNAEDETRTRKSSEGCRG